MHPTQTSHVHMKLENSLVLDAHFLCTCHFRLKIILNQRVELRRLPCPQSQTRIFPRDYTSHVWKVKAQRFAQLSQSTSWPTRAISSTEMLRTILGTCQELHCVFSTWHRLEGITKHDETVMKLLQANWGSVVQFLFGAFRSQWGELGFLVAE